MYVVSIALVLVGILIFNIHSLPTSTTSKRWVSSRLLKWLSVDMWTRFTFKRGALRAHDLVYTQWPVGSQQFSPIFPDFNLQSTISFAGSGYPPHSTQRTQLLCHCTLLHTTHIHAHNWGWPGVMTDEKTLNLCFSDSHNDSNFISKGSVQWQDGGKHCTLNRINDYKFQNQLFLFIHRALKTWKNRIH